MKAIYLRFHRWRGMTLFNSEPDLFSHVFKLGFVTVYVCKRCLLEAYRKLRSTIEDAVGRNEEGR